MGVDGGRREGKGRNISTVDNVRVGISAASSEQQRLTNNRLQQYVRSKLG